MRRKICVAFVPVSMSGAAQSQSTPVCITHFYNQSNVQWRIYDFDGRKSTLFIAPNSTVAINWGTTSAVTISGNVRNEPYLRQLPVRTPVSSFKLRGRIRLSRLTSRATVISRHCAGGF